MDLPNLPVIAGLTQDKVATLVNALKSYKQFQEYVNNLRAGKCPFCDPLGPLNKVIDTAGEGTDSAWRMWHNPFPIQGGKPRIVSAETHLVIAPVRHITDPNQMTDDDWVNQTELIRYAVTTDHGRDGMNLPGGGILTRFGRPELNAGSILHIHTNIIVPNLKAEVRPPLAKDPKEMETDYKILAIFAKVIAGARLADFDSTELALVKDRF